MFLWLNVPVLCFHEIYNKYVQGENLQIIDERHSHMCHLSNQGYNDRHHTHTVHFHYIL
jgi:hypothetical protein